MLSMIEQLCYYCQREGLSVINDRATVLLLSEGGAECYQ